METRRIPANPLVKALAKILSLLLLCNPGRTLVKQRRCTARSARCPAMVPALRKTLRKALYKTLRRALSHRSEVRLLATLPHASLGCAPMHLFSDVVIAGNSGAVK